MANTYRMVHTEPFLIRIQLATVSGWIDVESARTIAEAKEIIKQRKDKENWVVKYYDEAGDIVAEVPPTPDQPVDHA